MHADVLHGRIVSSSCSASRVVVTTVELQSLHAWLWQGAGGNIRLLLGPAQQYRHKIAAHLFEIQARERIPLRELSPPGHGNAGQEHKATDHFQTHPTRTCDRGVPVGQ